ncbi:O-antigen polymerase [Clostridium sp. DJ247]|uniref:O-antigen polymerase n=1 Tax=Clostridium sp. DJ247 TaxID=2726188 RepID=UPI0016237D4E|nr:O-antigen polymerase [Clostridium sp. DJ247]MBC2580248.1 oligosaccharide repeat unit polymerase [Clostridium sp. DJ247]
MEQFCEKISNIFSSDRKQNKLIALIFYILFVAILCVGYWVASKPYLSFNFFINPGEVIRAIKILPALVLIVAACVLLIPDRIEGLTSLYWMLFTLLSAIPILVVYIFNGIADNKNVLIYIYTIEILCVLGMYLVSRFNINFPNLSLNKRVFWIFMFVFILVAYGYLFITLGLPKDIKLAFKDVYAVRLNYRASVDRFGDYFVQWMGNVVNPFMLTYCIYKKKYKLTPLPIFLELILYIYTAYKSLFVTLVLAPFFGLILNKGINKSFIQKSIVGVALIAIIDGTISMVKQFHMFNSRILSVLSYYPSYYSIYLPTIVRAFIWPSLIALQYYDFFWMYPKVYLSHSILGHFFSNVYKMEPSLYLGTLYYGKPDMRLNVTWYGDAYMNFGIIGMIVFAVLLYFILFLVKYVEKKNVCLVASLLFGGIMTLFNGPLLTTLLTSGLGIGLFLAYLLPEEI